MINRLARVNELIKRVISEIIQYKLKDPNLGFITVTEVKTTKDLRHAKIYISVRGTKTEKENTIDILQNAEGYIVKQINKQVKLKYIPSLTFKIDNTLDYSDKIDKLLEQANHEKEKYEQKNKNDDLRFKQIYEKIMNAENEIAILAHAYPDGDSLASGIAMYKILLNNNKKCTLYSEFKYPVFLSFLPMLGEIKNSLDLEKIGTVIILDCAFTDRIGKIYDELNNHKEKLEFVLLDHHPATKLQNITGIVKPEFSSTSELLYKFMKCNGIELDEEMALCIYTGIISDTWNLMQENTTADSMKICGELVENFNIKPFEITKNIFENKSIGQLKLLSEFIATIKVDKEIRLGYGHITKDMYERTNTSQDDIEGFINIIRSIKDIDIAMMIRDIDEGNTKVTLRSKTDYDLLPLIKSLGGGGHKKAAGFVSSNSRDEIIDIIKEKLKDEFKRNNSNR